MSLKDNALLLSDISHIKYLSPKYDLVFKALFTKNKSLLRSFLTSVLDLNIENDEDIVISNNEQVLNPNGGKKHYLDLIVNIKRNNKRSVVNIEIQLSPCKDLHKRFLYYTASVYANSIVNGESYSNIPAVISLNILDFVLFNEKAYYHNAYALKNVLDNDIYPDSFYMHFIELPKLVQSKKIGEIINTLDENTCLNDLWLLLFKCETTEEFEELSTKNQTIKNAIDQLHDISQNQDTRWAYMLEQRKIKDYESDMYDNFEMGLEKGIDKVAKKMKNDNVDYVLISKYSGLSIEEIEAL